MPAPKRHPGILVGVDGSTSSNYAVEWAARDAALRGVGLTIVHAVRPIGVTLPKVQAPSAFARWQVEQAQKFLDDAVEIAQKVPRTAVRLTSKVKCCSRQSFQPWSICPRKPR